MAEKTDEISIPSYRNDIVLKKSLIKNLNTKFDDLIDEYNNDFSSTYIKFISGTDKKKFYFTPSHSFFLKKFKLFVDDFFYEIPSNFKINIEYLDGNSVVFYAIPSNHFGQYFEVMNPSKLENSTKFSAKKDFPIKVYDENFVLLDVNYSVLNSGFVEFPKLSYEKVYISYTPTFENYEYSVNSSVKSITIETDTPLINSVYISNF